MTIGATVALLFSDIEGSTLLLQRLGERYSELIRGHHSVMRMAIQSAGGREVDRAGDSFFAVFATASDAVDCAQRAQSELTARQWPGGESPRVRMGIHAGAPAIIDGEFVGIDVHRAARVMSVAHGGQVLLTEAVVRLLGPAVRARDLGYHRLKDLTEPEHLFQLEAPGVEASFPSLRSLNRSNLPTPANPLVGRDGDVARALDLLGRQDVRLLTLLGPGGVGKTRLSLELAAETVGRYRDGVWIAALAPISNRELMLAELARVLSIDPIRGEPLQQALLRTLADRELLLVMDNFEHLIDAAPVVGELLAAAPRLDVLCTSRQPLRIRGEQRMQVAPLPVEDARELFLQRALAAHPELTTDEGELVAIERICERLDGLPLALEMAAPRVAIFAPRVLEARLAESLALPEGPRDLPERQRTLRATIDWSYQLLGRDERSLLCSLAPFIGGVRIDSAESVWGPEATEHLISLAEKSLLRRREDKDHEPRFWMLETVREFALASAVADGSGQDAARVHADHYCELTDRAAPELLGDGQRRWVETLDHEQSNLRAALDWLVEHDPVRAVRMAANLEWFWIVRGYAFEGAGRLSEVLAAAPTGAPDRGRALAAAGQMALELGEAARAEPLLLDALTVAQRDGDDQLAAHALSHLGWAAEALADYDRGHARHVEAIAAARRSEDESVLGIALNNYAVMTARLGDLAAARPLFEESLLLARRQVRPSVIALTAGNLAILALESGELDRADALISEALTRARELDFRSVIAHSLATKCIVDLQKGNLDQACAQLTEAIEVSRSIPDIESASFLSLAATVAAIRRQPLRAAGLWAAADRQRERVRLAEDPNIERLRATWEPRARLESSRSANWDAAWTSGGEMSLDNALELASVATNLESEVGAPTTST